MTITKIKLLFSRLKMKNTAKSQSTNTLHKNEV